MASTGLSISFLNANMISDEGNILYACVYLEIYLISKSCVFLVLQQSVMDTDGMLGAMLLTMGVRLRAYFAAAS